MNRGRLLLLFLPVVATLAASGCQKGQADGSALAKPPT